MSEIYRGTTGTKLTQSFPAGTTDVSVTIVRNGVVLVDAETITASGTNYTYTLPFMVYMYDGPFTAIWQMKYNGTTYKVPEEHEVVTPLMSFSGIYGTALTEAKEWERLVRRIIESYTRQSFGMFYGERVVDGRGEVYLTLPQRLMSIEEISDETQTYDITGFEVDQRGWFVRKRADIALTVGDNFGGWDYVETYSNPDGVIYPPRRLHNFVLGEHYKIKGIWGYASPPQNVVEATEILYQDYQCKDATYRDRYIKEIRSKDWQMEIHDLAFLGTGSLQADQLLAPYVRGGITVV